MSDNWELVESSAEDKGDFYERRMKFVGSLIAYMPAHNATVSFFGLDRCSVAASAELNVKNNPYFGMVQRENGLVPRTSTALTKTAAAVGMVGAAAGFLSWFGERKRKVAAKERRRT